MRIPAPAANSPRARRLPEQQLHRRRGRHARCSTGSSPISATRQRRSDGCVKSWRFGHPACPRRVHDLDELPPPTRPRADKERIRGPCGSACAGHPEVGRHLHQPGVHTERTRRSVGARHSIAASPGWVGSADIIEGGW
jgi:hypothetical protein